MTYATQGGGSITLPAGCDLHRKTVPLNALKVVCYGWRSPARALVVRMVTAPGRWLNPLSRWTRPTRRPA